MSDRHLTFIAAEQLGRTWHLVRDGLRTVEEFGDGWVVEDIYHACKVGAAALYLAEDEHGNFDGAVVLSSRTGFDGKEVVVWAAWSPNYGQPLQQWCELIEQEAEKAGAVRLVFYSPRRAWSRLAEGMGFRERQVMYTKEM